MIPLLVFILLTFGLPCSNRVKDSLGSFCYKYLGSEKINKVFMRYVLFIAFFIWRHLTLPILLNERNCVFWCKPPGWGLLHLLLFTLNDLQFIKLDSLYMYIWKYSLCYLYKSSGLCNFTNTATRYANITYISVNTSIHQQTCNKLPIFWC